MRQVFADTGYWVALINPRDQLHEKAQELSQTIGLFYIFAKILYINKTICCQLLLN